MTCSKRAGQTGRLGKAEHAVACRTSQQTLSLTTIAKPNTDIDIPKDGLLLYTISYFHSTKKRY
jgi:hypothetical protein